MQKNKIIGGKWENRLILLEGVSNAQMFTWAVFQWYLIMWSVVEVLRMSISTKPRCSAGEESVFTLDLDSFIDTTWTIQIIREMTWLETSHVKHMLLQSSITLSVTLSYDSLPYGTRNLESNTKRITTDNGQPRWDHKWALRWQR